MTGEMRGVVLAGGLGTRLQPITRIVNKHLLPVYDRPMIYFPLDALRGAGVREVCVVVGGREPEEVRELLGDGSAWGFSRVEYVCQVGEGGIADALRYARAFVGTAPVCVILGDNVVEERLDSHARAFLESDHEAMVLLSAVDEPERFGVPVFDASGAIARIVEKPGRPESSYAVAGIYFYRASVFEVLTMLEPSRRGELEITDVNNSFAQRGTLGYGMLSGFWGDAGTFEGLFRAGAHVRQRLGVSAPVVLAAVTPSVAPHSL